MMELQHQHTDIIKHQKLIIRSNYPCLEFINSLRYYPWGFTPLNSQQESNLPQTQDILTILLTSLSFHFLFFSLKSFQLQNLHFVYQTLPIQVHKSFLQLLDNSNLLFYWVFILIYFILSYWVSIQYFRYCKQLCSPIR